MREVEQIAPAKARKHAWYPAGLRLTKSRYRSAVEISGPLKLLRNLPLKLPI